MFMPSIFGENLFDDFFDDFDTAMRRPLRFDAPAPTTMRTDIRENDDSFELDIDMPGYKKEDVKAELKDGYLTVCGTMKKEESEGGKFGKYLRRERFYGSCSRSFYVGEDVAEADIKAKFVDGILKLTVPKIEKKEEIEMPKYIAIEG